MADSKLENKRDSFRCPICLEEVRDPKYLPCFHTFCKSCIQTYISSTAVCKDDKSSKIIDCPVCRKSITAPRNDISSEEWACGLPQNKLIVSLVVYDEQSENKNCMLCLRNNKNVVAKHWCKTCVETICDDCKFIHSYFPTLQSHKILSLSDASDLHNDIEIDEPCPVHKGKFLEVFCQDHDQLCCSICFATNHRTCSKVESIEDVAAERSEICSQMTPTWFNDALQKLDNIQGVYKNKVTELNTKKEAICACTEKKVEEVKAQVDEAHAQWIKQFEQNHSDSVGNIETASDEVKRFATTVLEAKTLLEKIQKHGTAKQVFVTRYKIRRQILDHVSRLWELKIWDVVDDYNQPDTNFLNQLCNEKKFKDVKILETPSTTMETVEEFASKLQNKNIKQRREIMAQKDWMKIKLEKISEFKLPKTVYFGLFVDDTKVLLSVEDPPSLQVYDVGDTTARCVYIYPCSSPPCGLCHSSENLKDFFVSFKTHVEHYQIHIISDNVALRKIETKQLEREMTSISFGSSSILSRSSRERMICDTNFSVQHTTREIYENPPFVSSSFNSDQQAFTSKDEKVVIVDQNNKKVFTTSLTPQCARGLAFDMQDNIFVCMKNNKLRQIRNGGGESRDIDLPGIKESYNVVLHPTGEKVMVLDFTKRFCVYKVE